MKWLRRLLIAFVILLMVAIALPFLIPLDSYIPLLEQHESAALKQPVSIKSIRLAFMPTPHVTIDGIAVGKTGDIMVGEVTGNVDVSAKKELAGRINAQLKASKITAANVPLNASGTVEHPMVLPTRGTLAGAAIGTAVLPGVGTGVGAKAGQMIEGLLGGKKDSQQKQ